MQQLPHPEKQATILIVDDLEQNLELLENILEPLDARLILVQSGMEALERLAMHDIALALIDVEMPEMNGFELVKRMQQDTRQELFPVMFITAHPGHVSEIEKYYSTGVVDFITKPFKHHILLNKVKVFLELYRQKLKIREQKAEIELTFQKLHETNQTLKIRVIYENLLAKISEMAIPGMHAIDFFDASLAIIGQTIGASRTYIIEYCSETGTLCNTYEWCAAGITPQKDNFQDLPVAEIPWWHNQLINGHIIRYTDIDDIPEQSTNVILKAQDIFSILVVPLFVEKKYFGHIGFDFCYRCHEWQDMDVELLISISRTLCSVIERNISEREVQKRMETEQALLNASLDSVLLIDTDGIIIAYNEVMAKRLKFSEQDISGRCVYDLLPPDVGKLRKHKIDEVLRTGMPLRFADSCAGYTFEHSLYPVTDASGKVYRVAVYGHDITEKRRVENSLMESEKMYRTLLSASPQGIVILDMKRIIINISDITIEIFGAESINDFIGKDFFSIIPNKELDTFKTVLSKTISDGLVQNEEIILEKKNKTPFISDISATLIQDTDRTPKAYMVIIRDISQKKIMEQQLIHSERLVSLGEMASAMAHEINQPLLSIQFGIENLLSKFQEMTIADKNYVGKKSEKIFADIMRISHIIDHVGAFSRDKDYINASFNVNESISNAISMISQQFKHHGIKLTVNLSKECAVISGNTYRFEQVILNMLSNAKDAIEEKAGTKKTGFDKHVIIRSYHSNNSIFVEVKDNGCGIDENRINRILLPFYTTKEAGQGTGLGLSISLSIIKELGGNIEIESRKGLGSTFRILLPDKQ